MTTPADPPPKDAAKEAKEAEQAAHYALLEELDIHSIQKSFRSSTWKPNQRRNKNIKTILGDAQRREQASLNASSSVAPTPSGAETPVGAHTQHDDGLSTSGASTPAAGSTNGNTQQAPNLAQASRSLGKLVLEKSLKSNGAGMTTGGQAGTGAAVGVTYTNIESAPSLAPQRKYCDITGLKGSYQDPKTRLRYHNAEVFGLIRGLPQGYAEQYLEARGAHTVLK
ncbi:chromatin-remodeling complex subunit ies6 [Gnomoniopsis smithogilvyi]|uniref:Chromatin-remodeling complex subunit ies6 n=1 Tax=Gnomoniopsis smithogilvyi TaxID=1191159 RepID=A0A9W8YS85_9PEZI|nr:chromatin-remodeling complex subunit ies6 [Gnomoniopsis smithogilvyi]